MGEQAIMNSMGTASAEVAGQTRRRFGYYFTEANALCYRLGAEKLVIAPWGQNSFRVTATKCAEMPQEKWALTEEVPESHSEIRIGELEAQITNGKITAIINNIGKIEFRNEKGELLLEEYLRNKNDMQSSTTSSLMVDAREFKAIIGSEDYHLKARFVSNPEEKIFGMGQYQQPYLNQKGMDLELAHRNSQSSVPFMISSLGYGFLWNNPAVGRVNFGKNIRLCHNKQLINSHFYRGVSELPYKLGFTNASYSFQTC